MRAADGLLLGVLDDDPTGSQAVHGVEVVTVLEEEAYGAALAGPAATCFVLTNTRSMEEAAAAQTNVLAAGPAGRRRTARYALAACQPERFDPPRARDGGGDGPGVGVPGVSRPRL
jgi:hypothetical protein